MKKKKWYHEQGKLHRKQIVCYICKKKFSTNDDDEIASNKKYHKVRDHCHYAGKYRGAAHDICNLRYKTPKKVPIVFITALHTIITS